MGISPKASTRLHPPREAPLITGLDHGLIMLDLPGSTLTTADPFQHVPNGYHLLINTERI